ncbi:MAG: YebC/PmpR family DNA-binding transcriptional regulator [Phycisphaerales bacterium]|nr:YebC/PmpR family DNA-binding transcriptional regulator [Phycisphaerales bacterium]
MAGHSAWKNIKHRKAAVDAKRGKVWSKLSRAIIVAAKSGGGDIRYNATLRLAVDDAKAGNMPRDTIEKAVKKGTGEGSTEQYEFVRYEGYAAGGVAVIAESLVANPNKTAADIRMIFDKNGGNLGVPGSVSYAFIQRAVLLIDGTVAAAERVMELALAAGADDVEDLDGGFRVLGAPTQLIHLRDAFTAGSVAFESAQVEWLPTATVSVGVEAMAAVHRLIDALEEHDDVQKVFTSAEASVA